MTDVEINQIADVIRQTAFEIHKYHKHGHLEKIYENALAHRLRKLGLHFVQQHPIQVYNEDGTLLSDYFADLFVESCLIVEIKAVMELPMLTLLNYLAICVHRVLNMGYCLTLELLDFK